MVQWLRVQKTLVWFPTFIKWITATHDSRTRPYHHINTYTLLLKKKTRKIDIDKKKKQNRNSS